MAVGTDGDVAEGGTRGTPPLTYPHIQGAYSGGEVITVGKSVAPARIGERVSVRTM